MNKMYGAQEHHYIVRSTLSNIKELSNEEVEKNEDEDLFLKKMER